MKRPGTKKHRAVAVLGAALLASALMVPSAYAAADTTSVTITAGELTLSPIVVGDFVGKTVTGLAQTTNASMDNYSVSDLRGGLGSGWQLTAGATQFSDGGTNTLPANSLLMAAPVASPGAGNLAVPPVVTPGVHILDSGATSAIATATAGTGTGDWTFTNAADSLTLSIPANVVAATYTSTVTMTLGAAPALPQ